MQEMINGVFRAYGRFCAQRPWEVIITTIAVTISIMSMSVFTGLNRICGWYPNCNISQTDGRSDVVVLTLTKCLAVVYIYLQFSKLRKLGSKYILGIAGLFTVFSSFVFSTVVVNLIGHNLTGLNEALPYFLLLIDLSRASALARVAMSSKSQMEVEENIAQGMAELGPAITLDCLVESLVTAVGSFSGVPQLQTMCCFGFLSLLANYCAFMTFYPSCLTLILEISHGRSDKEPVWQIKEQKKQSPVEELKPNPVTQRVKLIMSAALLLVHLHRRFIAAKSPSVADQYSAETFYTGQTNYNLSPDLLSPSSITADDVKVWQIFWPSALQLRLDTFVTFLLATLLAVKYLLIDSDLETDQRCSSSFSSIPPERDTVLHGDECDMALNGIAGVTSMYENANGTPIAHALFKLGADSDDDDSDCQSQADMTNASTQTDDVNGPLAGGEHASVKYIPYRSPRELEECVRVLKSGEDLAVLSDEEVVMLVKSKHLPAYKLESMLAHHERGVNIRRTLISEALSDRSSLQNIPFRNYEYKYVDGACCENVIGYMPVPVGVAGPLLLDGSSYYVPMATTEGCLVASTNRGCRALSAGDGVTSMVIGDGMSRAPVARLPSAFLASQVKSWLEYPDNFQVIKNTFDSTSRFARLARLHVSQTGRLLYIRFLATTGDAMGMNMLSKGSERAMAKLNELFPELEVLSLSGNYCTDKKPSAINWIEGRGKSVVCEATIPGAIVKSVLKTTVASLVDLNINKNLIGSAMAGSLGGFNAHAANIVAAMFIACGQDAAQTVSSSQCMTLMEPSGENASDLYITCTMPCIEVGTIGGGTVLPPQSACLQMLGVQGSSQTAPPGENACKLARIVCATVLAGELSLMSALAAGHLVRSHLRHNRSMTNIAEGCSGLSNCAVTDSVSSHIVHSKSDSDNLGTLDSRSSHHDPRLCNQNTVPIPDGAWKPLSGCSRTENILQRNGNQLIVERPFYDGTQGLPVLSGRASPPLCLSFDVTDTGLCPPVITPLGSPLSSGDYVEPCSPVITPPGSPLSSGDYVEPCSPVVTPLVSPLSSGNYVKNDDTIKDNQRLDYSAS